MGLGRRVGRLPPEEPEETGEAGEDERPLPAPAQRNPRHHQRRHQRADVGAGIENAGRERALLLREPLGDGLDRGGKVARFAETEDEPRECKARRRARQQHDRRRIDKDRRQPQPGEPVGNRMEDRADAPQDDGEDEAEAGAQLVHHPAGDQQTNRVGELEGEDDGRVIALAPRKQLLQIRLQDRDDLPVDVVDRRRREEQGADDPAIPPDGRRDRRGHWFTPLARKPPSTTSTSPVTKLAASEAR